MATRPPLEKQRNSQSERLKDEITRLKKTMKRSRKINAYLLTTSLFLSQALSFNYPVFAAEGDVSIAGQPVFTLQSGSGATVAQRTETIQNNLDNALVAVQDRSPSAVGITYVHSMPVITLGPYQVLTVDQSDATFAKSTPAALAQQWADGIRQALGNKSGVESYVTQLNSGSGGPGAPPGQGSPQSAYAAPAPPSGSHSSGADQYNANPGQGFAASTAGVGGAPNTYLGPSQGGYGAPPQGGYGAPPQAGYGAPPQAGYGAPAQGGYGAPAQGGYGAPSYRQGRVAYAPAGQVIPITLQTSISTQVANTGDVIQASISQAVVLGDSQIPQGSVLVGQVTAAEAGRRLARSGELGIKFNSIRTPDGTVTPITAHLVGGIAKYHAVAGQQDTVKGEGLGNKIGSVAFRGLIGAGGGAALGTGVGAIAGGGYGAGMGAWSGAAIGGGLGAADSLLLRKGKDVTIKSGTAMQIQLDAPVSVSGVIPAGGGY
jgi:hypothetical protein